MKEQRNPHPHVDPRQPRDGVRPGTNPPVFVWKPLKDGEPCELTIARDPDFSDIGMYLKGLVEPVWLPEEAFALGEYWWKWSCGGCESEVFHFEITQDSVVVEVPPVEQWLKALPQEHPRIYIKPDEVEAFRERGRGPASALWSDLKTVADKLLEEPHEIEEPPYLADRARFYEKYFTVWHQVLASSRRFVNDAETLALAYLVSGDAVYARAACRRMASISRWDPDGSSHIDHNDEAHMSVIWHGPMTCDWVWEHFTDEELETVIRQFRRRGEINYEHMHNKGSYGVTRFDSHAGREIVFLAMIAFVFGEHIHEAHEWLEWLRPVLCGIWPIWAGDDGAWSEGPLYGQAYIGIMTYFASALKKLTGIDLYKRPFWRNHAHWRRYCQPFYAEWYGFGDCGVASAGSKRGTANLVELINVETGAAENDSYITALRETAWKMDGGKGFDGRATDALLHIRSDGAERRARCEDKGMLKIYPGAGWAAIRTDVDNPARDIAFIFRSCPYGSFSHSHADNNDFILHVGGKVLAMPSGYYDGYGSAHHSSWVWHTKSHNCLTVSGAGQRMRSRESLGRIENAYEDDRLTYMAGNADKSYEHIAQRCRRHVCFLKKHKVFFLVDEYIGRYGLVGGLEWNIHSLGEFNVNEESKKFIVEREGSQLEGTFMQHRNSFFSVTEGWDPPPRNWKKGDILLQHNLRFCCVDLKERGNLGVVLAPGHGTIKRADVESDFEGSIEVARIGEDLMLVRETGRIEYEDIATDALAVVVVDGRRYDIDDKGIRLE
ncbi:MAG: DUF4962 domain-containing protein [Planctomycetes bacterium]|nr:DUF4962 domain-containing protein [Planctomycetota bacterium]